MSPDYENEITAAGATQVEVGTPPSHEAIEPLWDEDFQPSIFPDTSPRNERTPLIDNTLSWRASKTLSVQKAPDIRRKSPQKTLNYGGNSTYRQTVCVCSIVRRQ